MTDDDAPIIDRMEDLGGGWHVGWWMGDLRRPAALLIEVGPAPGGVLLACCEGEGAERRINFITNREKATEIVRALAAALGIALPAEAPPSGLEREKPIMTNWPAEVIPDATIRGAWRVEKLDADGDGGVAVTIFAGPDARERAVEYAAWKYGPPAGYALVPREPTDAMVIAASRDAASPTIEGYYRAMITAYERERGE